MKSHRSVRAFSLPVRGALWVVVCAALVAPGVLLLRQASALGPVPTATTLTADVPASVYGDSVTLTAAVTAAVAGSVPAGTVVFTEGAVTLGTSSLDGAGRASFTLSTLTAGKHEITATYGGDMLNAGSNASLTQAVVKAVPTVRLFSGLNPSVYGQDVTLTATVPADATGTVEFYDDETSAGTASVSSGTAGLTAVSTAFPAGTHGVRALFSGDANYESASSDLLLQAVAKAPLSVAGHDARRLYGEPNPVFTGTVTGLQGSDTLIVTYTCGAVPTSPVGYYPIIIGVEGGLLPNYDLTTREGTLTLQAGTTNVILAATPAGTYGDAVTLTATVYVGGVRATGSTGTVTFRSDDIVVGTAAVDRGRAILTTGAIPAGAHALTASYGGDPIYFESTSDPVTQTVARKALTVTATSTSKTYGAAVPVLGVAYDGFVLDQDAGVLGGTLSVTTVATEESPVGTYTIAVGGRTSDNYDLTFVPGILTVGKKSLTVAANDVSSVYGDVLPAFGVSYAGFVLGQDPSALGGALTLTTAAPASGAAGTYPITPGGLTSENYDIAFVPGMLDITPRPITVTADARAKVYGDADPALSYVHTAGTFVGSDGFTGLLSRETGENAGTYAISRGTLTAGGNYTLTFIPGVLTVTQRPITVTADARAKVYGDADPAWGASVTAGSLAFDDVLAGALTRIPGEDVGAYDITRGSLTAGTNYDLTYVGGTLTVTRAALTVTPASYVRPYGSPNPALTGSIAGIKNGDDITAVYATTATPKSLVAVYPVMAALIDPGGRLGNYDVTLHEGMLTVKGVTTIVLERGPSPSAYGDAVVLRARVRISGVFATEATGVVAYFADGVQIGAAPLAGSLATFSISTLGAGSHTLTAFYDGDGEYLGSASNAVTQEIGKKVLTVTAEDKSTVYGDAHAPFTYKITGVAGGDTANVITGVPVLATAGSSASVGTYPITVDVSGMSAANYVFQGVDGAFTVTPRPITVIANDHSKTYGSPDPVFTYVIAAGRLVAESDLTGSLSRDAGEDAGFYFINRGTLTAGSNYDLRFVPGTLTIASATLNPSVAVADKAYDRTTDATIASRSLTGVRGSDDVSLVGGTATFADKKVGLHKTVTVRGLTLAGAQAGNYVLGSTTAATTASITALTVAPAASAQDKVYDGTTAATVAVGPAFIPVLLSDGEGVRAVRTCGVDGPPLVSVLPGDTVTAHVASASFVDANVGTGKTVEVTGFVLDGEDAGNYVLCATTAETVASITPRPITITTDDGSKTYGTPDPVLTYNITAGNLVGSDQFSGALSRTPGEITGTYEIVRWTLTAGGNYSIRYVMDGIFVIRPASLTPSVTVADKIYDGTTTAVITSRALTGVHGADSVLLTGGTAAFADKNAGTAKAVTVTGLTLAGAQAYNYVLGSTSAATTAAITPRLLPIIADTMSKTYGMADPAFTYRLINYAGITGDLARIPGEDVGAYEITRGTLTAGANANFDIEFVPGTLTIGKKTLTVTANDATRVYGAADPAFTARYEGFVRGETGSVLRGSPALGTTAVPASPVGAYSITAGTGSLAADNYDFAFAPGTLRVVKAPTATSVDSSRNPSVSGQSVTFTATVTPATASGTVTFTEGSTVLSTVTLSGGTAVFRTSGLSVGTHAITASYGGDGNHTGSVSASLSQAVQPLPQETPPDGNGNGGGGGGGRGGGGRGGHRGRTGVSVAPGAFGGGSGSTLAAPPLTRQQKRIICRFQRRVLHPRVSAGFVQRVTARLAAFLRLNATITRKALLDRTLCVQK